MRFLALALVLFAFAGCESDSTAPTAADPSGTYQLQSITSAGGAIPVTSGTMQIAAPNFAFQAVARFSSAAPAYAYTGQGGISAFSRSAGRVGLFLNARPGQWAVSGAPQPYDWNADGVVVGNTLTMTIAGLTWVWVRQ